MPLEYEVVNTFETPPGGWHYIQPETGHVFETYSYPKWIEDISKHRFANGIPVTADLEWELQDDLCKRHPEWANSICRRVPEPQGKIRINFHATLSFIAMLLDWLFKGLPTVSQEVAEERASICAGCPFNRPMSFGCGLCTSQVTELLASLRGQKRTSKDDLLGICGICSCSLKAAIHFPVEVQKKALNEHMIQEFKNIPFCWKGKEL
jgi:hypothetical protein